MYNVERDYAFKCFKLLFNYYVYFYKNITLQTFKSNALL